MVLTALHMRGLLAASSAFLAAKDLKAPWATAGRRMRVEIVRIVLIESLLLAVVAAAEGQMTKELEVRYVIHTRHRVPQEECKAGSEGAGEHSKIAAPTLAVWCMLC